MNLEERVRTGIIPEHIAVIMDGDGLKQKTFPHVMAIKKVP